MMVSGPAVFLQPVSRLRFQAASAAFPARGEGGQPRV